MSEVLVTSLTKS